MKKRYLTLITALALAVSLLAGCAGGGSAESAAPSESAAASEAPAPASEAPASVEPAPAESAPAESAFEAEAGQVEVPELAESGTTIAYPISDEVMTFDMWKPMNGQFQKMMDSYEDNTCLAYIQEKTGVNLDFIEPSEATSTEQFNLMIASGEYPDLMECINYSGGGLSAAYADGIILDLTDMIPEHAPDYWAAVEKSNEATVKALKDDDGRMYCLYTINNVYFVERGLETRYDWLQNLGLDIPQTTEALYEVMKAIKAEYDTPYTFNVDANGVMDYVVGAWGISGLSSYLDSGKVVSSLNNPALKDYTTYVHNMYADGLINKDFYNAVMGPNSNAVNSLCGFWYGMADSFSSDKKQAVDPGYDAIGIGAITMNEGDEYHFGDLPTMTGRANLSISTTCEDPEKCMEFVNWFFTDDGFTVANYGLEGQSFEYNEAGEPKYLDVVVNNPEGWNKVNAKVYYCFWNIIPFYNAQDALLYTYTGREVESMDTWTDMGYDQKLPTLSYTVDEAAEHSTISTEITTYVEQEFLKFIVGDTEINDANWSNFVSQVESMELARMLEIEQAAYERYLAR